MSSEEACQRHLHRKASSDFLAVFPLPPTLKLGLPAAQTCSLTHQEDASSCNPTTLLINTATEARSVLRGSISQRRRAAEHTMHSSAAVGAVVAVAVAALLYPSAPGAELTTSWLKLTALDRVAWMGFMVCGMHGSHGGTSIFGTPWRQCFEGALVTAIRGSAAAGDWGGILSEDVRFEAPALGSTPARELTVRVYREGGGSYNPAHPEQRPVLLWLHGGGFTIEHTNSLDQDLACRALAAEGGWVVVSVEYRLAPEHPFPAALHDAYAALTWLAAAAAPGPSAPGPSRPQVLASADLARLAVGGDSAGGNMAALLAVLARDKLDPEVTLPLPLPLTLARILILTLTRILRLTLRLTLTLTRASQRPWSYRYVTSCWCTLSRSRRAAPPNPGGGCTRRLCSSGRALSTSSPRLTLATISLRATTSPRAIQAST